MAGPSFIYSNLASAVNRHRLFMVALMTIFSGCAGIPPAGMEVEKNAPVVYIRPLDHSYQRATLGVLPFQVPAGIPADQGLRASALFKDVLLGKRVFPMVRQLTDPYGNLDEALKAGREAGVSLVMAGRIDHLLAATELGGGRVSVSVRFLDTISGHTVWYVAQSAAQEMDYPDTSFGNRLRSSLSVSPVRQAAGPPATTSMLTQLAIELAEVIRGQRTGP